MQEPRPAPRPSARGGVLAFFIDRPIFASVISILISLVGGVYALTLPTDRFPDLAPPVIRIAASYPGANAAEIADAVATPLEQEINGAEGLIYISSNSTNDGRVDVSATFRVGYDANAAVADVLTRVNRANSQLPQAVRDQGLQVRKSSPQLLGVAVIRAEEGAAFDELFLDNYAETQVIQQLLRVPGIGDVRSFSNARFAIRVWLDPVRMEALNIGPAAVVSAVRQQNVQITAGSVGGPPQPQGTAFELQLITEGRLRSTEDFASIILRANPDGSVVRVRDVGRVELGAESYGITSRFSGQPSTTIGLFQAPGANAVQVMDGVKAAMEDLARRFPEGVRYDIASDRTTFVTVALHEVVKTLIEAIVLVTLVTYLFLQNWRATLIPVIAIPVSLLGAFFPMGLLGFSLNTLSLLGLVLAVGLVVDDAIVVIENTERNIEEGQTPLQAARNSLAEVAGPVIATTLVLLAIFVPVAFIPGITGRLYNQFALTIAIAVFFSGVVSLTLTPALCALLLKPRTKEEREGGQGGRLRAPLRWFNRVMEGAGTRLESAVGTLSARPLLVGAAFAALVAATVFLFLARPTAFVPDEDQGYFFVSVELPEGASLERTQAVMARVAERIRAEDTVANTVEISGNNNIANISASYAGFIIPTLKPWDEREATAAEVQERLRADFNRDPDARIRVINAPSLPGIGARGGLTLRLEDRSGGTGDLRAVTDEFVERLGRLPEVGQAFSVSRSGVPQLRLEIDRPKAEQLGVPLETLFDGLRTYVGSAFVNQFNLFNRVYQVYVQGDAEGRRRIEDVMRLTVPNAEGEPVQIGTLVRPRFITGDTSVGHYNTYPAADISVTAAGNSSTGALIRVVEELAARELPREFAVEWTDVAYQEKEAGGLAPLVFGLGILLVFLVLAAQYESWTLPLVVILAVPLAVFGAVGSLALRSLPLDIFAQIGLLMLVGLAAKNAILIVAFARDERAKGRDIVTAARDAARLRLRPILMTSFAFILGALPLALASGAGANARISIGTTVVGGLLVATVLTMFFTPALFTLAERLRWQDAPAPEGEPVGQPGAGD